MVAMKEPWIGLVELLTPPSELGDTRCFTKVIFWAESAKDYAARISQHLQKEDMSVLDIEYCHPVSEYDEIPEDLERSIEWARSHPDDWQTSDRHYYPSRPG